MTLTELERLRRLAKQIDRELLTLEKLRSAAAYTGAHMDGMPHGSGPSDRVANLAANAADQEEKIIQLLEQFQHEKDLIQEWMIQQPGKIQCIVTFRFLDGLSWEEAAARMADTSDGLKKAIRRWFEKHDGGG